MLALASMLVLLSADGSSRMGPEKAARFGEINVGVVRSRPDDIELLMRASVEILFLLIAVWSASRHTPQIQLLNFRNVECWPPNQPG